jgi:hypothetical protein
MIIVWDIVLNFSARLKYEVFILRYFSFIDVEINTTLIDPCEIDVHS